MIVPLKPKSSPTHAETAALREEAARLTAENADLRSLIDGYIQGVAALDQDLTRQRAENGSLRAAFAEATARREAGARDEIARSADKIATLQGRIDTLSSSLDDAATQARVDRALQRNTDIDLEAARRGMAEQALIIADLRRELRSRDYSDAFRGARFGGGSDAPAEQNSPL